MRPLWLYFRLLEFEFARTEAYYRDAAAGVHRLQIGRWGVMTGLEVYRAILASIRRNNDYFAKGSLPFIGLPDPTASVLKLYGQEVNLFKLGRMAGPGAHRQGRRGPLRPLRPQHERYPQERRAAGSWG